MGYWHLDTEIEKMRNKVDTFLETNGKEIGNTGIPNPTSALFVLGFNAMFFGGLYYLLSLCQ